MMHDIFSVFPEIILPNGFKMRQLRDNDVQDFFEYISDAKVRERLSLSDAPSSLSEASSELKYWANLFPSRTSVYWGIADVEDKLIGTCGFNYWTRGQTRAEISYDVSSQYWGQGIATNAIKEIVDFGFSKMKVTRIQATVEVGNVASCKVLEKNGFKREGILVKYGYINGVLTDYYMYAITAGA